MPHDNLKIPDDLGIPDFLRVENRKEARAEACAEFFETPSVRSSTNEPTANLTWLVKG